MQPAPLPQAHDYSPESLQLVEAHRDFVERSIKCLRLHMQMLATVQAQPSMNMEEYSDTLIRLLDEQMYENQDLGDQASEFFASGQF